VQTSTNLERMTRTTREMTEAQRESYEALAESFAAFQKRSVGLTQEGMEFLRLQEESAKAAQQWFASSMKVAQLQQRNVGFAQSWLRESAQAVQEQTEHNLHAAETFARSARKQQESIRDLVQGWTEAYEGFFFSPFNYAQEGLKAAQEFTDRGLRTTQQVARQGLRVAEEATEQTEEVLRKTEDATREAELRTGVLAALKTDDYEKLTVAEITEKLDGLTAEELKQLREFEKRNKDRETLVERIDRKIRANS
jgi:hypothetical protein